jgi:hypothetical protein
VTQERARTEQLTIETLPGIGRTYETTDLDGDRVGVVVLRGEGVTCSFRQWVTTSQQPLRRSVPSKLAGSRSRSSISGHQTTST